MMTISIPVSTQHSMHKIALLVFVIIYSYP